jgi:hypothetical protein
VLPIIDFCLCMGWLRVLGKIRRLPPRFFGVRWRLNRVDLGLCGGITSWIRGKREVAFPTGCVQIFRRAKNSAFSNLILVSAKDAPSYCLTDLALSPLERGFDRSSFVAERLLSQNGFA